MDEVEGQEGEQTLSATNLKGRIDSPGAHPGWGPLEM